MSGDFLRLHCVRGDLSDVCRAVERLVGQNGWIALPTGKARSLSSFYKEVNVREERGWIVIDAGELHSEPWAERVAAVLRTTGITMTSFSEEGAIELERYDAGRRPKRVSHEDPGARHPKRLPLAFLADLVPAAQRPKLRKGVLVGGMRDSDASALEIAHLANLPTPLATHEWPEDGHLLRFEHPRSSPIVGKPGPARGPRSRQVLFEDAFHVRGVDRKRLERALKETLALHDFVPVGANADEVTWAAGIVRVFVHEQSGSLSFGEVAIDDGRTVPDFRWGALLSRKLSCPVLSVWRDGEAADLALWEDGDESARVGLGAFADSPKAPVDARALHTFVAGERERGRLRSLPGDSVDASLEALGDALGLRPLALAGTLEGLELRFRRAGAVNHRPYAEEQSALDWGARAPHLARLNPVFQQYADLTPEKALRERLKPAQRV